jgi:cytochrome bd-type quinol oxidase subunit 2
MLPGSFIPVPEIREWMVFPPSYYIAGQVATVVVWVLAAWLLLKRPGSVRDFDRVRTVWALVVVGTCALWLGSLVRAAVGVVDAQALTDKVLWNPVHHEDLKVPMAWLWLIGIAIVGFPIAGMAAFAAHRLRFGRSRRAWWFGGVMSLGAVGVTALLWLSVPEVVWRPPLATLIAEHEARRADFRARTAPRPGPKSLAAERDTREAAVLGSAFGPTPPSRKPRPVFLPFVVAKGEPSP